MSVGSAFDAIVKSRINRDLDLQLQGFGMVDLIVAQCEPETLPKSLEIASDLWDQYYRCGAYGNLLAMIRSSSIEVKMEYDLTSVIGGVPLLGKPDLHFGTTLHAHVITDWKVSGSCSACGVSPQQGYMLALDVNDTRTNGHPHKKFKPNLHPSGVVVNDTPMNETTDYWADQLATYAWCLGEPVGSQNFIARIEQIAVRPIGRAKCVVHQATVDADYQRELLERYQRLWAACQSGHIFWEMSREQSDERCEMLIRNLTAPDHSKIQPDVPTSNDIGEWFS